MSARQDPVRAWLAKRGCPDFVVTGGLEGLVARWAAHGKSLSKRYDAGLDDWLNDLDARQLIAEAWSNADEAQQAEFEAPLARADKLVQKHTTLSESCLWGAKVQRSRRYTRARNWWYYVVPVKAGDDFATDLARVR